GDFDLHLVSKYVRVTGDDFSNFFLRGSTDDLNLYIANGDGRVEAQDLEAGSVEIQHRGTNKLFVNPQQVLKGEIRSTGDVISVNRPPVVEVESFYTGKLIFE
ncbi:GIN domain-containing protein, partial [Salinimicrobium oceani]